MSVYDSDFEWPAGDAGRGPAHPAGVAEDDAAPNQPRIGVAEQTNARAVLGTVPVEADGSVVL